ncbi:MAG: 2,3-bisphosphoglycerate-independent phosphoglycerate mutase, partial [Porticoccaceae bacterium]|nr:2,3-bisphosphoglycerate-independent phosphoglycerate mutase [Porticoccaceae bacterium]
IADGDFFTNPVYVSAIDKAVQAGKAVHIIGLLSPGGVHSHEDHILAACELAAKRGASKVYVHAFLDGRDCPPRSALPSLEKTDARLAQLGVGQIASLCGRYYAMDRDSRWDRVQSAYDLLTLGKAEFSANSATAGLQAAYQREENDEFVQATTIEGGAAIADGDAVLFMNFRPDRARQITRAFVEPGFDGFQRSAAPALADFVMTTEYAANIDTPCAFPPQPLINSMGEYLASQGKTQLRIAETEKYAHVTFFYSGGREELYGGEERILVPSPQVATYDLQPEMSAGEVTDKLVAAIEGGTFDAIICNYANGDMVGHTGVFDAAVKAAEYVDQCVGRIVEAVKAAGGDCLITADHGNLEEMFDANSGQISTQHSTLPVPFVYVGEHNLTLTEGGSLADVAPTMLALMELQQPAEMGGRSLAIIQ